jgi:chemotaxis protein MotB
MDGYEQYDQVMKDALKMARPNRLPWIFLVLVVLAAAGGAYFLLRQLDAARGEAAASANKILDLQDKLDKERAAKAELDQQRERLEAEKKDLLALKEELSKSVQSKDEELSKLKGTYDELQEKMKAEIAKGDIQLSNVGGRLKVDLIDKVLFDSGEADISKRGEEVLARVGAVLARMEDKQIQVSGHTDDAPISARLLNQYPTNWELSAARATHVVRFLQEKAGVPGRRLTSSGYGPYHPVASNARPTGRARNRRIEILLTPAFDPTPSKVAVPEPVPVKEKVAAKPKHRRR